MIKYLNATEFEVRFLFEDLYEVKSPCGKEYDLGAMIDFEVIIKILGIKALISYDTKLGHTCSWSVCDQHLMSKHELDNNMRLVQLLDDKICSIIKFMIEN